MTVEEYRIHFRSELEDVYEEKEIESLSFITFNHAIQMNRIEVSLSRNMKLSQSQLAQLEETLDKLKKTIPVQYIIGKVEFYGLEFQVNPHTLIPRPETEELVDWVLKDFKEGFLMTTAGKAQKSKSVNILDIGTGSGCIAISLSKNLEKATVDAVDISQNALATAYQNAKANNVEILFFHQNILETDTMSAYDVIVSNPPYVRTSEKKKMHENVVNNEPESALYVPDDDPLLFYRKIGKLAFDSLVPKGFLYFEINEFLGEEMVTLMKELGFQEVILRKDMFGKDRMLRVKR